MNEYVIDEVNTAVDSLKGTENILSKDDSEILHIDLGSDRHLDALIRIRELLADNTLKTKQLVEAIHDNFNRIDKSFAESIVARVFPVFSMAKKINLALSAEGIYEGIKQSLEDFNIEIDDLFEIINDLSKYKLNPMDYDSLLGDI